MVAPCAASIDLAGVYTLVSGLLISARADGVVQIGSEPPRWLLLHDAPPNTVSVLKHLDGTSSIDSVLFRHQADPELWNGILTRLTTAGLLVPAADWSFPGMTPGPFLEPERDSLVHRHGVATAARVLRARQDAVVVVRGSGRVASAIARSLALSGVGHVHHQPDRALRLADVSEFSAAGPPAAGSPADAPVGAPHHARSSGTGIDAPSAADFAVLSTNLRRAAPTINIHPPVTQHRIALVVLAGDGPPAPSLAAELTGQRIPHLAVSAGMTKAVLGPFVLPGRSSCLLCALRQRTELDDGRPALEEDMRRQLVVPPAQLVASATALAVGDALDHVDGVRIPGTVDGTVEWQLGDLAPRRRSWAAHPDCGCRSTGAPDSRLADRPGA